MNGLIAEQHIKYVPSNEQHDDYFQVVEAAQKELESEVEKLGFRVEDEWMLGFGTEYFKNAGTAKRSLRNLGKDEATRDSSIIGFVFETPSNGVYDQSITFYWVNVERI